MHRGPKLAALEVGIERQDQLPTCVWAIRLQTNFTPQVSILPLNLLWYSECHRGCLIRVGPNIYELHLKQIQHKIPLQCQSTACASFDTPGDCLQLHSDNHGQRAINFFDLKALEE